MRISRFSSQLLPSRGSWNKARSNWRSFSSRSLRCRSLASLHSWFSVSRNCSSCVFCLRVHGLRRAKLGRFISPGNLSICWAAPRRSCVQQERLAQRRYELPRSRFKVRSSRLSAHRNSKTASGVSECSGSWRRKPSAPSNSSGRMGRPPPRLSALSASNWLDRKCLTAASRNDRKFPLGAFDIRKVILFEQRGKEGLGAVTGLIGIESLAADEGEDRGSIAPAQTKQRFAGDLGVAVAGVDDHGPGGRREPVAVVGCFDAVGHSRLNQFTFLSLGGSVIASYFLSSAKTPTTSR